MSIRDGRWYRASVRAGLICAALLLCGAAEKGPQGKGEHAPSQPQAEAGPAAAPSRAGQPRKPKPPPCSRQGSPSTTEPECREALAAERAAEFTKALVAVGAIQAVLLLGQIIALVVTIWQSRVATKAALDSVGAAQRSAKAAEDAVAKSDEMLEHSRSTAAEALRSSKRVERAYVFLKFEPIEISKDNPDRHQLYLRFSNAGKTPAVVDKFYFGVSSRAPPDPVPSPSIRTPY